MYYLTIHNRQAAKGDPLRKRESFIQDLKRSINGDADLRQLLLNKAQLRQWSVIPHSQALLVQHRSVWTQKASGMLQTSEDFLRQVSLTFFDRSINNFFSQKYVP